MEKKEGVLKQENMKEIRSIKKGRKLEVKYKLR